MKFFLPKQPIFFELLSKLANLTKEIALLFKEFTDSFTNFSDYSKRAKEIEHQADETTHKIIDQLNKTFVTPIDREDIYLLAHKIDDIIDLIENVVHNIELFKIEKGREELVIFAGLFLEAAKHLNELINCLQNHGEINSLTIKLHSLEDQGDLVFQEAIKRLFEEPNEPILVIKWKDILENLEIIMDKYQEISDVVEGIIVKSQ